MRVGFGFAKANELTDAIRDLAQSGKKVQAFELEGAWADVRDPVVLAELNRGKL